MTVPFPISCLLVLIYVFILGTFSSTDMNPVVYVMTTSNFKLIFFYRHSDPSNATFPKVPANISGLILLDSDWILILESSVVIQSAESAVVDSPKSAPSDPTSS